MSRNHEAFLLTTRSVATARGITLLRSEDELPRPVASRVRANWFVLDERCLEWLDGRPTKGDFLYLVARPKKSLAILNARFARVWAPFDGMTFLAAEELVEALGAENRDDLLLGGVVDAAEGVVLLVRGSLEVVEVSLDLFKPSGASVPDFEKFKVVEYGTAVAFGEYTATADSILYDVDAKYRKAAKKRRLEQDSSLGGSLKRLRLLRGLSRNGFEPEVSAKEVERIESGKVKKPRDETLKALAKRLRVKARAIASY